MHHLVDLYSDTPSRGHNNVHHLMEITGTPSQYIDISTSILDTRTLLYTFTTPVNVTHTAPPPGVEDGVVPDSEAEASWDLGMTEAECLSER